MSFLSSVEVVLNNTAAAYFRPFDSLLEALIRLLGYDTAVSRRKALDRRDDKVNKINLIRRDLESIVLGLDDLQKEVEKAQTELTATLDGLEKIKEEREKEENQHKQIRNLISTDVNTFRKLLGMRSVGFERLVGFFGGIVASLIAAALWKFGEMFF